MVKHP